MEKPACCNSTPVVGTRFDGNGDRSPSTAIIEAVAAAEDVAPTELDPMYDALDPGALDTLLTEQHDASICIRFTLNGWTVFVRGDGAIRVCEPTQHADPAPVFEKPIVD